MPQQTRKRLPSPVEQAKLAVSPERVKGHVTLYVASNSEGQAIAVTLAGPQASARTRTTKTAVGVRAVLQGRTACAGSMAAWGRLVRLERARVESRGTEKEDTKGNQAEEKDRWKEVQVEKRRRGRRVKESKRQRQETRDTERKRGAEKKERKRREREAAKTKRSKARTKIGHREIDRRMVRTRDK